MGFGLLEELQKFGYRPARKCETTVLLRPEFVGTAEFAEISGLKLDSVKSLCLQGIIPSLKVGSDKRFKFKIDWQRALETLRSYADCGAVLSNTRVIAPISVSDVKRMKRKTRKKAYRCVSRASPESLLEKKRALKE